MLITPSITAEKIKTVETVSMLYPTKAYLRTLGKICAPLMLSAFSSALMIFLNRIVLAKYDTHVMVATNTATNIFFVFQFGFTSLAMIAEVFVGQFNGAQKWDQMSRPVWQMIWLSLFSAFLMVPIGLFGAPLFIPEAFLNEGGVYFKWMMLFGPIFPVVAALSAFFIGKGDVKIITIAAILGNILNLFLAFSLVFGIPGLWLPQGAKGVAIASGIAELAIAGGLFYIFLQPHNRQKYDSHRWHFHKALFLKCIHIGFPNALGHVLGTAAWALSLYLLSKRSIDHVTVLSIGLSIWALFSFITEGLQKGVTALAANAIGAKRKDAIPPILISGLWLQFFLALILAIPLVIAPQLLVGFFMPLNSEASPEVAHLRDLVEISCRWLWIAYLFDGMAWVIDGILTAVGDTRFILFMNSIGTWLFFIAPLYWFIVKMEGGPMMTLQCVTLFSFILFFSYFLRYKKLKWKKISLIEIK